jgi:ATP-dependent DNA helicase RecG
MDRSITDANLKDFNIRSRFYRNRRIGEFLKELDLAEGRNTGIGKIVRAMRENGSPDPQFYNPETRSFMTVILPIHEAFKVGEPPVEAETVEKTGMKTGMKTGDAIIALIEENPFISHDALAERLMKARSSVIEQISKLKASGRIRRVGPDKGGALGSREVMAERGIVVGSERI